MNVEEKTNKEFFYILNKIKELAIKTPSDQSLRYWVGISYSVRGGPSREDEELILEKLKEIGAINILNPGGTGEYV